MPFLKQAALLTFASLLLAGCGQQASQDVQFDFSQRAPYPTTAGVDQTWTGTLEGTVRLTSPPSVGSGSVTMPALVTPSTDGSYELVMQDRTYLLTGRYTELAPYVGRRTTLIGKLVTYRTVQGDTYSELAPRTLTFSTP